MLSSISKLPQKSFKLKQDDKKGSSKRVTRDVSMANLSTEDYHVGASVAVPFTWESQPGTPKIKFREKPLPPLTPPPSYFYNTPKRPTKKLSKSSLLDSIFPKRSYTRKTNLPVSPASSSSSSSSSSRLSSSWSATCSVPSSPMKISKSRGSYNGMSSPRQNFDTRKMMLNHDGQDLENECEYPVSTLCFGGIGRGASARSRGCYASMIKVLFRGA